VHAKTEHGHTALHLAVESGVLSSVALCLTSGADVNAATNFEKNTPLHMAVQDGKKAIALYLMDMGADVNARNAVGRSPLHLSAASGRVDLAHALVLKGADGDMFDAHGWSVRQIAEYNGFRDLEEYLVRMKLTVSQSVLKELPPAEWQSSIWDEVVGQYADKRDRLQNQQERAEAGANRRKLLAPPVPDSDSSISISSAKASMASTLNGMLMSRKHTAPLRLESNTASNTPQTAAERKQRAASNILKHVPSSVPRHSTADSVAMTVARSPKTVPDNFSVISEMTFNN
jgi:hypothetical protein